MNKYEKYEKSNESTERIKATTREKQKIVTTNSSSNLKSNYSTQCGSQNKIINISHPLTPVVSTSSTNSFGTLHSPSISPERKKNLFPPNSQQTHIHTNNQISSNSNNVNRSDSYDQKKPNQI
jgi:hypothetical protein